MLVDNIFNGSMSSKPEFKITGSDKDFSAKKGPVMTQSKISASLKGLIWWLKICVKFYIMNIF